MQSDGGALAPQEAGKFAIRTALSGPAGGVKAAEQLARYLELGSAVTFDMGGTSTDVALLQGGRVRPKAMQRNERILVHAFPQNLPSRRLRRP